ncbi:MAG TPA: hypothetical protein PK198_07425 [Saprospiraceae bacterium]|nr:hypothetical protein [Saprospiraceae bacterium]HRK81933.1 hypothetical protein [Saprospiraceae bacterium]
MKTIPFALQFDVALCAFLLVCGHILQAQTFENTIGQAQSREIAWDGKPIPGIQKYVVISNSFSGGDTSEGMMLFSRFQNNGKWELSKIYATDREWIKMLNGRAIERGVFTGRKNIVYIAGERKESANKLAFLMIADEDGTPIHAQHHVVTGAKESMTSSLETINPIWNAIKPGVGSVIATGNILGDFHDKGPKEQFFVAYFKSSLRGGLVWSFRYFDPSSARIGLHVNKTCLGELSEGTKVVVATGYQIMRETRQLFVSCIDLKSGTELWRQVVLPEMPAMTEGFDVVQDPQTRNFVAVGYYHRPNGYKQMYVAVWDQKGSFLGATHYSLAGNIPGDIVARDVICSIDKKSAVVSGYLNSAELSNRPKTFALELPFTPLAANPLWAKYYERSKPDPMATESIQLGISTGRQAGYFITSQANKLSIQPETYGIHIIHTDQTGNTLMSDPHCAVLPFQLNHARGDKAMPLERKQEETRWKSFQVFYKEVTLQEQPCR